MDTTTLIGVIGGAILVLGSAWPDRPTKSPIDSTKNRLFAVGNITMLLYSVLNYLASGSIFFLFLEGLVILATIFMLFDVDDRIDTPILMVVTFVFVVWAVLLSLGYATLCFILGLACLSAGYSFTGGTVRRGFAFFFGSALIAYFSYIESNQIFFWLNVFFAGFSGYQLLILSRHPAR